MIIQKNRIPVKEILLVGLLPSWLKILVYRLRGYKIGKGVSLGLGCVVCGEAVEIGDYTSVGFFTIIRGKKISIGPYVSIGATTFLDTPNIEIGEGTKINEQVFVGGLQWPDSKFVLGKNCQIMQMSFINPAVSVVMGDESGCGGHSLIFGHSSWLSVFDGYPMKTEPIELGNNVSLTWRTFVLPGVKIGDGTIVGPNSLVNSDIPEKSMAAGFPARVLSRPPDFPRYVSDEEKVELFYEIEKQMVAYFTCAGLQCSSEEHLHTVTWHSRSFFITRHHKGTVLFEHRQSDMLPVKEEKPDVYVSLQLISEKQRQTFDSAGTVWFDLASKVRSVAGSDLGEEVALFIRRYGVRFTRFPEK